MAEQDPRTETLKLLRERRERLATDLASLEPVPPGEGGLSARELVDVAQPPGRAGRAYRPLRVGRLGGIRAGKTAQRLWRLPKRPHERTPHPLWIAKADILRHHVDRIAGMLHALARAFQPQTAPLPWPGLPLSQP